MRKQPQQQRAWRGTAAAERKCGTGIGAHAKRDNAGRQENMQGEKHKKDKSIANGKKDRETEKRARRLSKTHTGCTVAVAKLQPCESGGTRLMSIKKFNYIRPPFFLRVFGGCATHLRTLQLKCSTHACQGTLESIKHLTY